MAESKDSTISTTEPYREAAADTLIEALTKPLVDNAEVGTCMDVKVRMALTLPEVSQERWIDILDEVRDTLRL